MTAAALLTENGFLCQRRRPALKPSFARFHLLLVFDTELLLTRTRARAHTIKCFRRAQVKVRQSPLIRAAGF